MASRGRRKPISSPGFPNGTRTTRCGRCIAPSGRRCHAQRAAFHHAERWQHDRRCERHGRHHGSGFRIGTRHDARAKSRRAGDCLADRGHPRKYPIGPALRQVRRRRRPSPLAVARCGHRADAGVFSRGGRPHRRRDCRSCDTARTGRGLDRSRLARRRRGVPTGLPRPRPLQRHNRDRPVSVGSYGGHRTRGVRRTGARGAFASAQESEKPQCGPHGARARHRRRDRPWLDRLRLRGDGALPARR